MSELLEYTVVEEDVDLKSIAHRHKIWEWYDLYLLQRKLGKGRAGFLKNPDDLQPGDVLYIPRETDDAGRDREALAALSSDGPSYLGGETYLSPWGTVSFTLDDEEGKPLQGLDGARFEFRDPDGEVVEFYDLAKQCFAKVGRLTADASAEVELPLTGYHLWVGGVHVADTGQTDAQRRSIEVRLPADFSEEMVEVYREKGIAGLFPSG